MDLMRAACFDCGEELADANAPCPECGQRRKEMEINLAEVLMPIEELAMVAEGADGTLKHESASKSGGVLEGGMHADCTSDDVAMTMFGRRNGCGSNIADENRACAALAAELERSTGLRHETEQKVKEDSDIPDVWIRKYGKDASDVPFKRIGVQVTHMDREAIGKLGQCGEFRKVAHPSEVADSIAAAIHSKQLVDRKLAMKTLLLLIVPYPITATVQALITERVRAMKLKNVYGETWVCPFREPPFRVHTPV